MFMKAIALLALLALAAQDRKAAKPFLPTSEFETRMSEGWTLRVDRRLLGAQKELGTKALQLLDDQLRVVLRLVPAKAVEELRKVPIWLCVDEGTGAGAEYHPSKSWLEDNGYNPDKAKAVELGKAADFLREVRRQPVLLLHELAHSYHDRVLGFGHAAVKAAYEAAKASGKYEKVLFWDNRQVKHYALTNPQEYFAESSEAFFGTNDFFPFVRAELKEFDPEMFRVLREVWGEVPAPSPQDSKKKEEVARWMSTDLGPVFSTTMNVKGAVPKAIAIRVGPDAAVCYDEDLGRIAGGWTGGFVKINPERDALLGNDSILGKLQFWTPERPGWDFPDTREAAKRKGGPLPRGTVRYRGLYLHGDKVVLEWSVGAGKVLEHPWAADGAFMRSFRITGLDQPRKLLVAAKDVKAAVVGGPRLVEAEDALWVEVPAGDSSFTVVVGGETARAVDVEALTKGGPRTWTETLVTKGARGADDGPWAIDTLTPPFENPWKAILHFGGHDFYADGSIAVCTMEGDVWKVSGVDDGLEKLSWQRIATGLYHPLGLKIVKDVVHVACRDQIARLHDLNGDGQIDWYECFNNDVAVGTNSHEFMTCLETDPEGNFFTVKGTNEGQTIHDSSVLRVSKDGSVLERWATGFRWPNGLGMGPRGELTTADQQGTWMPSSRLDWIEKGGFYGYMNSHHREKAPAIYDGPLCWIPHGVDNSSGGQVWVEGDRWGLPAGRLLHLSYGKCVMFLVLDEKVGEIRQAGVVQFPLPPFLSGVMRGRFHGGSLYVSGLRGWQTSGVKDGAIQRVRYTGKKIHMPVGLNALQRGVRLTFAEPLSESAGQPDGWSAARWNYKWAVDYGSPHFSVENPKKQGEDRLEIKAAKLSEDRRSVVLEIDDMKPVMQMKIGYTVLAADGTPVKGAVYHTIHALSAD